MVAEKFLSGLNANIFLREFSFDKNQFKLSPNEEVEFADHVIWIDDLLFLFQVKEREKDSSSTRENEDKWFTKKILGKATKQIRDSVQYLSQQRNISIQNQRGHKFELTTDSIATIIKVVLYLPNEKLAQENLTIKFYKSRSAGFIHVIPLNDYLGICQTLITPAEIKKYFLFREDIFEKWPNEINVLEPSLVGQFLYGEFNAAPNDAYLKYYKAFLNSVDEFDISQFLDGIAERIENVEFPELLRGTVNEANYYKILEEFAKLTRTEWKAIKERMLLCLDASRLNEFCLPYRITIPTSNCGFIFIPITEELLQDKIKALRNLTFASKHEQKLQKSIGISFAYENGQFLIDWLYADFPWKKDEKIESILENSYPFRKLKYVECPPYYFDGNSLEDK